MLHTTPKKHYLLPIGILFAVISLLLLASLFILTPNIQSDLAKQVQQALTEQGIPAEITLSGRDVTLKGHVSDNAQKEKAGAITKKICGIRFVDNQLLTEKPENLALINKPDTQTQQAGQTAPDTRTKASTAPQTTAEKAKQAHVDNTPQEKPDNTQTDSGKTDETDTTQAPSKVVAQTTKTTEEKEEEKAEGKNQEEETATPSRGKRKVLDYESMLAAMQAYQREKKTGKSRNARHTPQALDIHFSRDSSELNDKAHKVLDDVAKQLKTQKNRHLEITVSAPRLELANKRANTIRDYLRKQDIASARIKLMEKQGADHVSIQYTEQTEK